MINFSGYWIEDIALVIVTLVSLFGGIAVLRKQIFAFLFPKFDEQINSIRDEIKEVKMQNYMLIMHSQTISLKERINAGQRYIDNGGNGGEEIFLEKLKDEYKGGIE
jgi:hypothetical protein